MQCPRSNETILLNITSETRASDRVLLSSLYPRCVFGDGGGRDEEFARASRDEYFCLSIIPLKQVARRDRRGANRTVRYSFDVRSPARTRMHYDKIVIVHFSFYKTTCNFCIHMQVYLKNSSIEIAFLLRKLHDRATEIRSRNNYFFLVISRHESGT